MLRPSRHATQRMLERRITWAEVQAVHRSPHTTYDDPDGKPCRVGTVNGKTIKLVLAPDDENLVITTMTQG